MEGRGKSRRGQPLAFGEIYKPVDIPLNLQILDIMENNWIFFHLYEKSNCYIVPINFKSSHHCSVIGAELAKTKYQKALAQKWKNRLDMNIKWFCREQRLIKVLIFEKQSIGYSYFAAAFAVGWIILYPIPGFSNGTRTRTCTRMLTDIS